MISRYESEDKRLKKWIPHIIVGASFAAIGLFIAARYRVAGPTEYIVRTGLGIKEIAINKHAIQWPFQTYRRLSMVPRTFSVEVDAMSKKRIPFKMPTVWTIGPQDNPESLKKYSQFLIDKDHRHLQETVEGIIQGEARILAADQELDALFNDRATYKNQVTLKINDIIKPFGLTVYNSNISELTDLDANNLYFSEQKKRALQKVNQAARVDVSEANREGETGEKENQSKARQQVAEYEKNARIVENSKAIEIAASYKDREVAEAGYEKEKDIAKAEAKASSEQRKWELQQQVEIARNLQEIEKLRASQLSVANVEAEIQIKKAEGEAASTRLKAEAQLFAKQKEADGILAIKAAEAKGLEQLLKSAGNADNLSKYLLVSDNKLEKLAHEQGEALRGLQPKIHIWNTGPQADNASKVLTDLFRTGIPLFSGIKEQTGLDFFKPLGLQSENSEKPKAASTTEQDPTNSANLAAR